MRQVSVAQHGRNYRYFLLLLSAMAKLPDKLVYTLLPKLVTQVYSPIRQNEETIHQAMVDADIIIDDWSVLWKKCLVNHAHFCLNAFKHASFDQQWLHKNVDIDHILLNQVKKKNKGALFLTYHHAFQHTLFCVLGLTGFRTQVLAAHEESTPLFPYIGQYIYKLHRNSAIHFNGGDYLFFKKNIRGARLAKNALLHGDLLVSLNDFATTMNPNAYPLFNRSVSAPIGSIQIACRSKLPIILGIMYMVDQRYHVSLRLVESNYDPDTVMNTYFSFLSETLTKYPEVWDGWNWFSSLPLHHD